MSQNNAFLISWRPEKFTENESKFSNNVHFSTSDKNFFTISFYQESLVWQNDDYFCLFSGFQISDLNCKESQFLEQIAYADTCKRKQLLNLIEGYFSLLIINKSSAELILIRDKYGCYPLYFSLSKDMGQVTNQIWLLQRNEFRFDPLGLYESLYYRWLSGSKTLELGVNQVPSGHYVNIHKDKYSVCAYWNWQQLASQKAELNQSEATKLIDKYLDEYFQKIEPQVNKVLLPLSGGVDSSILAAKAKQHLGSKCVVGIIEFDHENPELETAEYFANTLALPVVKIKYSDQDIIEDHTFLVDKLEQLPRHYSSMPFYRLLNHSDEYDAIIYGEPGDTFFGSHTIKRLLKRFKRMKYANRLPKVFSKPLAESIIPNIALKIKHLQNDTVSHLIHNADKIAFTSADKKVLSELSKNLTSNLEINQQLPFESESDFFKLTKQAQLGWVKTYMMITDITDHIITANKLIDNHKVKLLTPLTYGKIAQLSWQISPEAYFGKQEVKEVLRELGCQFFKRESMYAPKFGFNTPFERWVNTLSPCFLNELKDGELIKRQVISRDAIENFTELSTEMKWTLYHLEMYYQKATAIN